MYFIIEKKTDTKYENILFLFISQIILLVFFLKTSIPENLSNWCTINVLTVHISIDASMLIIRILPTYTLVDSIQCVRRLFQ